MKLTFSERVWEDSLFWQKVDREILKAHQRRAPPGARVKGCPILIAQVRYHD